MLGMGLNYKNLPTLAACRICVGIKHWAQHRKAAAVMAGLGNCRQRNVAGNGGIIQQKK